MSATRQKIQLLCATPQKSTSLNSEREKVSDEMWSVSFALICPQLPRVTRQSDGAKKKRKITTCTCAWGCQTASTCMNYE